MECYRLAFRLAGEISQRTAAVLTDLVARKAMPRDALGWRGGLCLNRLPDR